METTQINPMTFDSTSDGLVDPTYNWKNILRWVLLSREIDLLEESELYSNGEVVYQFSARGHELPQVLLGSLLTNPKDGIGAYYRSRPLLLSVGANLEDVIAGPMGKSGGYSDGRDIGVVCNMPSKGGATVLPASGDVGSQYTPIVGWAESLQYRETVLGDSGCADAVAVAVGGDGSVATNGFWSSLTIATTRNLPVLFLVEDNGFGISVPSEKQTPGGNIAENLRSFGDLFVMDVDGTEPTEVGPAISDALSFVRYDRRPALLRVSVPRLSGHSGQDRQAYKNSTLIESELKQDPLDKLERYLIPALLTKDEWREIEKNISDEVRQACEHARARPAPDESNVERYVFSELDTANSIDLQKVGGIRPEGVAVPKLESSSQPENTRINLVEGVRRVLKDELARSERILVFGEDVGQKGGVHAATLGLQDEFGEERVFDTSLSEEGIIGRSVGMALSGLIPIPEIQFRKYADPATEQLHNCGTLRWRTNNQFAAPIVVRMPGGFSKHCGDPWHSVSDEVQFAHWPGWQIVMPSNAEDAVGLLRSAIWSNNPTIFFEHRALLDSPYARRPYPGKDYIVEIGKGRVVRAGSELSIVTWGAMVERAEKAVETFGRSIEVIDLRSIFPWDKNLVLSSVAKTKRCLIVHEDCLTAGFGSEVAATLATEAFFDLDAPIDRLAVNDIPIPYNRDLMESVLPTVEKIIERIDLLLEF